MKYFLLFLLCIASKLSADWVDDTLNGMTLDEKIGQLLIVGYYPNQEEAEFEGQNAHRTAYVEEMIQKYHVGGVIFKYYWDRPFGVSWDPLSLATQVNHFQKLSKIPLLMSQDQEWGLNHRHSHGMRFPKNMTLGAIQDEGLLYDLGREIGRQAKLVGIFCTNTPVVDVNSNPENPIISDRSFGDNPQDVARKGLLLMQGLQDAGIAACAKHFPGHGDTEADSHTSLPKITASKKELKNCALLPFQKLIDGGLKCIMSAHILVPAYEKKPKLPATLSPSIMTKLLQKEMGFDGVIITDDMLMKAVTSLYPPGEAAAKAFQAGCTQIMSSKDIPESFQAIKKLIQEKKVPESELNDRVKKILRLKKWLLDKNKSLQASMEWPFPQGDGLELKKRLYREAITFLNFQHLKDNSALLQVGGLSSNCYFNHQILEKRNFPLIFISKDPTQLERQETLKKLANFDQIIVSFCEMSRKAKDNFGMKPETLELIKDLRNMKKNVIYVLFGSPYVLKHFEKTESILVAYEDDEEAQKAAGECLLGHFKAKGKLPINL